MADQIPMQGWFNSTPGNVAPSQNLNQDNVPEYIDYAMHENGGPGYRSALINLLRGVRILGPGNQMTPIPDDTIGLVFVNRPMLNLSDENVRVHPQLRSLVAPPKNTINSYVKGLLDPAWGRANSASIDALDPFYPWMAPISNLIKVCSGFPDVSLEVGRSTPGIRKEVYQYVTGILPVNYDFDMTLSFYPSKPHILPYIFDVINHYIDGVSLGDEGMEPYPEALIQNYRDYDMTIFTIIMNKNMRNVEGIYNNGYCWPNTFPSGAFSTIDRTGDTLRGQGQDELEIRFPSVGFRYNNFEVIDRFNNITLAFNPNFHPSVRSQYYKKLEVADYFAGNYHAYPWINPVNMEMEYWSTI
jgi:hypothetical protein